MSFNHDGRGKLIGYVSDPQQHDAACAYRTNGGKLMTCNCSKGTWDDGAPTPPNKLELALHAARAIASADSNIAYPSRVSSRRVRLVMADLIEAVEEKYYGKTPKET